MFDDSRRRAQKRLIDATLRLAERRGSISLRVVDILTEAGASRTEFYDLFSSKDDLLRAVRTVGTAHMASELEKRMSGPALRQVAQWVEGVLVQANDKTLAARHFPFVVEEYRLLSQEGDRRAYGGSPLTRRLRAAIESAQIAADTDVDVAVGMVRYLVFAAFYEHIALGDAVSKDDIRTIQQFALRGLGASEAEISRAVRRTRTEA